MTAGGQQLFICSFPWGQPTSFANMKSQTKKEKNHAKELNWIKQPAFKHFHSFKELHISN